VPEITDLITAERAYEINSKFVQAFDKKLLRKSTLTASLCHSLDLSAIAGNGRLYREGSESSDFSVCQFGLPGSVELRLKVTFNGDTLPLGNISNVAEQSSAGQENAKWQASSAPRSSLTGSCRSHRPHQPVGQRIRLPVARRRESSP